MVVDVTLQSSLPCAECAQAVIVAKEVLPGRDHTNIELGRYVDGRGPQRGDCVGEVGARCLGDLGRSQKSKSGISTTQYTCDTSTVPNVRMEGNFERVGRNLGGGSCYCAYGTAGWGGNEARITGHGRALPEKFAVLFFEDGTEVSGRQDVGDCFGYDG